MDMLDAPACRGIIPPSASPSPSELTSELGFMLPRMATSAPRPGSILGMGLGSSSASAPASLSLPRRQPVPSSRATDADTPTSPTTRQAPTSTLPGIPDNIEAWGGAHVVHDEWMLPPALPGPSIPQFGFRAFEHEAS